MEQRFMSDERSLAEEEILIEIKRLALLVQAYEDFSEFLNSPAIMPKEKRSCKKNHAPCFLRRRCSISSMC